VADEIGTRVVGIKTVQVEWEKGAGGRWVMKEVAGSKRVLEADLVLLAMGFVGPEKKIIEARGIITTTSIITHADDGPTVI